MYSVSWMGYVSGTISINENVEIYNDLVYKEQSTLLLQWRGGSILKR